MAKLIGGTVTATATPTSIYDLMDTAGLIPAGEDPTFVRNLTIRNADGANDLLIGGPDLDSGSPETVMLTLVAGASLAEILQVYHVDYRDIFLEGDGAAEILGLQ
jgi:hypothetical protein